MFDIFKFKIKKKLVIFFNKVMRVNLFLIIYDRLENQ